MAHVHVGVVRYFKLVHFNDGAEQEAELGDSRDVVDGL